MHNCLSLLGWWITILTILPAEHSPTWTSHTWVLEQAQIVWYVSLPIDTSPHSRMNRLLLSKIIATKAFEIKHVSVLVLLDRLPWHHNLRRVSAHCWRYTNWINSQLLHSEKATWYHWHLLTPVPYYYPLDNEFCVREWGIHCTYTWAVLKSHATYLLYWIYSLKHSSTDLAPGELVLWNSGQGMHPVLPTLSSYESTGHGLHQGNLSLTPWPLNTRVRSVVLW